ncbi:IS21 family transposase [Bacillus fonticola]|uniref:IS21 family transposase n=1 Tax=Bacillus fonticola TaxID=2728853 RepID=UPI0014751F4A|nr:IS21 family transposase [Bacillus fonticola]
MLTMSDINCIKHLRNEKGLSIDKIATTLGINWRTAKKYADEDVLYESIIKPRKGMMYEEKWGTMVSDWLFEDEKEKQKLRRNNLQLFKELQAHDFKGSYRTCCNFIQEWRVQHDSEDKDRGSERLEHPVGDAQVDFGVMEAVEEGKRRDIRLLIMSFPFSNVAFYEPLPSENQECFLEGLKKLFDKVGGVPRKIRIDNLTPAVKRTRSKTEEAQLTDEFLRFQLFYGFETQVCNVRKGNEKGHVEKKVGYIRYNFFSVPPVITGLEDLSDKLLAFSIEDQQRQHYRKEIEIRELWEEEKNTLKSIDTPGYSVRKEQSIKVNPYNEIKIDDHDLHIPKGRNYIKLFLVLTWDKYQVVTPDGEIIAEGLRPYMNKRKVLPWQDIFKAWRLKPRVVEYSRYRQYLPGRMKEYLSIPSSHLRKQRIEQVLTLLTRYSLEEINEDFYKHMMADQSGEGDHPFDVNWNQYDQLGRQGGVEDDREPA